MAIVRTGDTVAVSTTRFNSKKIRLTGQAFQVEDFDPATGILKIDTGDIMGQIELYSNEVKLTLAPKVPALPKSSSTLEVVSSGLKTLINKYKEAGGVIDTYFLEQILGRDSLEQILSKVYISTKNNICSEDSGSNISSEIINNSGANTGTKLPKKKGGRPPGSKNTKPASGWLDKYESKTTGKITWYFCRDEWKRKTHKTKITSTQKEMVEGLIKSGHSASQIENLISDDVEF